jgi:pimeloyl-ACP methyl ester carboxylesterase
VSSKSELRPIVLVPGACLGGWAFQEVATQLRALGHDVHSVTLTGLGERVHLATRDVDLNTHIADVVNLLDYEDLTDVVLLGHSYAGVVVAGVADRRPERLHAVVYLDTGPLPDGMAIADVQTDEQRETQRLEVEERGEGWRWPVPDRETLLSGMYGSASGLEPAHFELMAARGTPQPYATFTTPLRLGSQGPTGLRRVAIFGAEGGMSVALLEDLIAQRDPRADVFSDADWELHELPTGHWAMFSLPGPLVELIATVAQCSVRTSQVSGG